MRNYPQQTQHCVSMAISMIKKRTFWEELFTMKFCYMLTANKIRIYSTTFSDRVVVFNRLFYLRIEYVVNNTES